MGDMTKRARAMMHLLLGLSLFVAWALNEYRIEFEALMENELLLIEQPDALSSYIDELKSLKEEVLEEVRRVQVPFNNIKIPSVGADPDHVHVMNDIHITTPSLQHLSDGFDAGIKELKDVNEAARRYRVWQASSFVQNLERVKAEMVVIRPEVISDTITTIYKSEVLNETSINLPANQFKNRLINASYELQPNLREILELQDPIKFENASQIKNHIEDFSKLEIPFMKNELKMKSALLVTIVFMFFLMLSLCSTIIAMGKVCTHVEDIDGYDWVFFQSRLGFLLGSLWLSLPVVVSLFATIRYWLMPSHWMLLTICLGLVFTWQIRSLIIVRRKFLDHLCQLNLITAP